MDSIQNITSRPTQNTTTPAETKQQSATTRASTSSDISSNRISDTTTKASSKLTAERITTTLKDWSASNESITKLMQEVYSDKGSAKLQNLFQSLFQERNRMVATTSNLLQSLHDTMMTVVRNLRA